MELVSFEINERVVLIFKKREEECGFLKGEDYFEVRKRLLDVQNKVRGRSSAFFLNGYNYFEMKENKFGRSFFFKYCNLQVK